MRLSDLHERRVAVWGSGREGQAVVRALRRLGISSTVVFVDDSVDGADTIEGTDVRRGGDGVAALLDAEVVVRSPGVSRYRDETRSLHEAGVPITTATNLFLAEEPAHVIGVTGTKGKSTTTALITHLLETVDVRSQAAGNLGQPPLDLLGVVDPQWWVLELSSFQCADLVTSPHIGVLTTLSAEHLDWHGDEQTYRRDKLNLFEHRPDIVSIVNINDAGAAGVAGELPNVVRSGVAPGVHVTNGAFWSDTVELFPSGAMPLPGKHNLDLGCLALAVVQSTGVDLAARADVLRDAMAAFEGLPHRLRLVAEYDGVRYVDDSLSTTPLAAIAALDAYAGTPTTVLLGGFDRGLDCTDLARRVASSRDVKVVTMAKSGPRFADLITSAIAEEGGDATTVVHRADDLESAVRKAALLTPRGGVVLLSPAAPSFGEFTDYAQRGQAFRVAAERLAAKRASKQK